MRRQLVRLVETGALAPGDRLPPLRQLAGDLGLAVGTVARSYREVEAAGLLVSRRGGGTRVAADVRPTPAPRRLRALADGFRTEARRLGFSDAEIRDALTAALEAG
nr:GntR family transcriptional regulator [Nocardioides flavescens]